MLPNVRGIQSIVAQTYINICICSEAHLQSIDEEILLAFSQ